MTAKFTLSCDNFQTATWTGDLNSFFFHSYQGENLSQSKRSDTPHASIPSDIGTAPSNSDAVFYGYAGYLTRHLLDCLFLLSKTSRTTDRLIARCSRTSGEITGMTKRGWYANKRRPGRVLRYPLSGFVWYNW